MERGKGRVSSQHLERQIAILCLTLQSHLLVSLLLLVAVNSLPLMLKGLLACAVGTETPEGWQLVPGKVLMAFSGPGEAVGDDPVPCGFAVFLLHGPVGNIRSSTSQCHSLPTYPILQDWRDPRHVGHGAVCLKWKRSWKMLRASPKDAPHPLCAALEVRAIIHDLTHRLVPTI